jgi:hypothetical protein
VIRMIKLITPPGMLLTTALLTIYGTYALLNETIERSLPLQLGDVVSVVAIYGTAMVLPWSARLVYLLTAGVILKLGRSIHEAYRAGFFEFTFDATAEIAWSLIPSLVMALLGIACCAIVRQQFRPVHGTAPTARAN